MPSPHLFRSTARSRDRTRVAVRALTMLTAAGSLGGAGAVIWATAPSAEAVVSQSTASPVAPSTSPQSVRPSPPASLTRKPTAPSHRSTTRQTTVARRKAPAPAVTTSGGS